MIITKYFVLSSPPSIFEAMDWFMDIIDALITNEFNAVVVGSLIGSIDDDVEMIDAFVRDREVEFVGKIIGELEGAGVAAEGSIAVVGLSTSVGSIVES